MNKSDSTDRVKFVEQFAAVRNASVALVTSHSAEDECVQSMPDASPTNWTDARLPTEFERVAAVAGSSPPAQAFGQAWQWTRSSCDPYPRLRPAPGAVSEYNGKFMVSQIVLRGSSAATTTGHARMSYRIFFPPAARWQFSGLRLARDL